MRKKRNYGQTLREIFQTMKDSRNRRAALFLFIVKWGFFADLSFSIVLGFCITGHRLRGVERGCCPVFRAE